MSKDTDTMTINSTDGKSRLFDEKGNLISIDGVKVQKAPPVEKVKEGGKG